SAPPGADPPRELIGEIALEPGARLPLLAIAAPAEDDPATSGEAYAVWYEVALPDGRRGWLQAAVPSSRETGADGRPSSVMFNLFPSARTRP
ncbi:MAG TPA: hypothetical protein VGE07_14275, partial [Herpetosiphonaceae bacterium]